MAEKNRPGLTSPTRVRFVVLALIALAPASAYLTRIISVFNTTLVKEFNVSNKTIGEVIAAFALGYFVFQVPGGMLASAYGVRNVLPVMSLAWGLCAIWGGTAGSANELYYSRVALGVAQAGLVPCCAKVITDWFPLSRRGIISAIATSSMQVGGIAATGLSARLLAPVGWRALMQVYGLTGIVWAVVFFVWFRNRPGEHPGVNEAEQALIDEGRLAQKEPKENKGNAEATPLDPKPSIFDPRNLAIFLSVSLWAYFIQAFFRAYGYEFFTSWCPAYLEKAYELTKEQAGELASWPLLAFGVGSVVGGVVVDAVLVYSRSRWISRSGTAFMGLIVCAICLAAATLIKSPALLTLVLVVGCLFASLAGPATWAAGMDLGGRYTPVIFGVMNMIGNIGSYYCPMQVGRLFDHIEATKGNWALILWLLVGINLAGAAAWLFVNPRRSVAG
jgi:sugar phosphate permease